MAEVVLFVSWSSALLWRCQGKAKAILIPDANRVDPKTQQAQALRALERAVPPTGRTAGRFCFPCRCCCFHGHLGCWSLLPHPVWYPHASKSCARRASRVPLSCRCGVRRCRPLPVVQLSLTLSLTRRQLPVHAPSLHFNHTVA